jgi:cytidylate kinase
VKQGIKVAIDGTAGSGKTTIGQMLAAQLNCPYLDTGAMYRAVSLLALQQGVTPAETARLVELATSLDFEQRDATPAEAADGRQYTVLVGGEDVSQALRSAEVEGVVSQVSAVPPVRVELVRKQREMAEQAGTIIMIGRDIGSVVLPDARLKIYLDASAEERARRRLEQAGKGAEAVELARAAEKRDKMDSGRAVSPLVLAPGAVYINTDNLTPAEVLERVKAELAPLLE